MSLLHVPKRKLLITKSHLKHLLVVYLTPKEQLINCWSKQKLAVCDKQQSVMMKFICAFVEAFNILLNRNFSYEIIFKSIFSKTIKFLYA